ncbi:right-handed parallel beta-helix repeat-containing protein [Rudaea cellulosilytica]|uniref:right-handed parallel beta-helix repeat-containing protein n=1 Tax=Rudaea cellulosilytica TaxID=540746 RepID=UPI0012F90DAD|nr:right-handed parallel beta-helix repeat-containing protein [Rudaea cellulosilytica]
MISKRTIATRMNRARKCLADTVRLPRMLAVVLAGITVMAASVTAHAAIFNVNNSADTVDSSPGDGNCADAFGNCTLRAAVMEANALPGAHTINLPAGTYILAIAGRGENAAATGDLDITGNLTITGAGAALTFIDGGTIDRVFDVLPGAVARLDGITVRNGNPGPGGATGGGISNAGTMVLSNSTVASSTAGDGGGIYNGGTMAVEGSLVVGNAGNGGAFSDTDGLGGGISNSGTMTVNNSTVSGNTAPGVYWWGVAGGGIFNDEGMVTVTASTISGNTVGSGVVNLNGNVIIENSTVSGNTGSTGLGGGGIFNASFGAHATLSLISSTVAANLADAPDGFGGRGNALAEYGSPPGSITVKNSILASVVGGGLTCYTAPLNSLGHNLASDNSCGLSGSGDLNNTDPMLGPLAANGGQTMTHALLDASPAIDAVPVPNCTNAAGVALVIDQRGVSRPQGPACDMGAFEHLPPGLPCPSGAKVNVRWHYSANGSSGGWSGTKSTSCVDGSVAIGPQAMEGDLKVAPGATLKVGYDFTLPGNTSHFSALVSNAKVVFQARCVSGAAPSIASFTATMPNATYSVTDQSWYPSADQRSSLVFERSLSVPDLCGGGQVRLDKGGVFSAVVLLN